MDFYKLLEKIIEFWTTQQKIIVENKFIKCHPGHRTAFTCSKLSIETLEQGVKDDQSYYKDTRKTPLASFWCLYC